MKYSIQEILDDLMNENNLSISKLSKELNMDYKQISNYLKGKFLPSLKSAITISNYFHCSLDYLFGLSNIKENVEYAQPDFNFYERYLYLLSSSKITHYKLTKDLKININDSRRWKLGAIPKLNTLIKITEYLGSSLEFLIGRTKNSN